MASLDRLAIAVGRLRPRRVGAVVVKLDRIGDYFLWLPFALALRHELEQRHGHHGAVVLVGNALWADHARRVDAFAEVIGIDPARLQSNPLYRFATLASLARLSCQVAIQPAFSRVMSIGDAAMRAIDARERVAPRSDLSNMDAPARALADGWYTRLIDVPAGPGPDARFEAERHRRLHAALGIADAPRATLALLRGRVIGQAAPATTPYIVLAPGASGVARKWPSEQLIDMACLVAHAWPGDFVLVGDAGEQALGVALRARLGPRLRDRAGTTTLDQLAALVAGARVVVSAESAAAHLCMLLGTPLVLVMGGGHMGRFFPYPDAHRMRMRVLGAPAPVDIVHEHLSCFGCDWRCIHGAPAPHAAFPCIASIAPQRVALRVLARLGSAT